VRVWKAAVSFYKKQTRNEKLDHPPLPDTQVYDKDYAALIMYTDGFLTGANLWDVQNPLIGNAIDTIGRMKWIEHYCRTHPLEKFYQALISFRNFLKDQRQ
jgi:hypothetical protein